MIDIAGKTHLVFDFDKTLFWLDIDWDGYFDDVAAEMKSLDPILFDDYESGVLDWGDMQNKYVRQFGSGILKNLQQNSSAAERKLLNRAVPHTELIEFIRHLSDDIFLYIWSSNSRELVEDLMREYGLLEKFTEIITRSDVEMLKPCPDGFLKIYDSHTSKSDYLLLGDKKADRLAAKAAGIDFHLITMPLPE